ncbi:MAG: hypothetical protein AAB267_05425 [Candidatus Desantisbacteria bacterium]
MKPSFIYEFTPYLIDSETKEIVYRPILPVIIIHQGIETLTLGLIDSGADECSFPGRIGREIGHKIEKGRPRVFGGVGGTVTAYLHQNYIRVQDVEIRCDMYFSDEWNDWGFGLLGRHGFFTHFKILFDYPHKRFRLTPIIK